MSINQLRNRETPAITYISLKLYPPIRSKALLQKFGRIGICSSYRYVVDIISDWAANVLQVYKDRNQVIPLKLRVVFAVFTIGSIDKNSKSMEATKHFRGWSICAFQSRKSVDDGIARRYSHIFYWVQLVTFPYRNCTHSRNTRNITVH